MKADKMVGLTSSAFSDYEDKYNEVLRLRDIFNKQLALDEKIEKVEVIMTMTLQMRFHSLQSRI